MNERIREYFEKKYKVDLSDIKIEKAYQPFLAMYDGENKKIILSDSLVNLGTSLAFLLPPALAIPTGGITGILGMASTSLLSVLICHSLSPDCTISHEYAHAAWNERIRKYVSFRLKSRDLYSLTLFLAPYKIREAFAVVEEHNNPNVPKVQRAVRKLTLGFYYLFGLRKYIKLFNALEKINPEGAHLRSLEETLKKVEKSKLSEEEKEVARQIFEDGYRRLEESGMLEWIEGSPAVLPEKWKRLERLIEALF